MHQSVCRASDGLPKHERTFTNCDQTTTTTIFKIPTKPDINELDSLIHWLPCSENLESLVRASLSCLSSDAQGCGYLCDLRALWHISLRTPAITPIDSSRCPDKTIRDLNAIKTSQTALDVYIIACESIKLRRLMCVGV